MKFIMTPRACSASSPAAMRLWGLILLILAFSSPARAQENLKPLRTALYFSSISDINEKDAEAVVKTFTEAIFLRDNIDYRAVTFRLDSPDEALQLYLNGEVDVMNLNTVDYVDNIGRFDGIPVCVNGSEKESDRSLVLLVHKDSKVSDIANLGGQLNILDELNSSIPQLWLDSMLLESVQRTAHEQFKSVEYKKTLMSALLPVFMKQADACIVSRGGFETMCLLNPQVERSLRVLAESEPITSVILFWNPGFPESDRTEIVNNICNLQHSVEGRQLLEQFRIEKMVPFDHERHLNPSLTLIEKYKRLIRERNEKLFSAGTKSLGAK